MKLARFLLFAALLVLSTAAASAQCANAPAANVKTKSFSNAASSTTAALIVGVPNTTTYICAINIGPVASAVNVAVIEGSTAINPCDTSPLGLFQGATAATGWQFAANGGLTYGDGTGILAKTTVLANSVCILYGGSVQVAGVLTYAQF